MARPVDPPTVLAGAASAGLGLLVLAGPSMGTMVVGLLALSGLAGFALRPTRAVGGLLAGAAALFALRAVGAWPGDQLVAVLILLGGGAALVFRQGAEVEPDVGERPRPAVQTPPVAAEPRRGLGELGRSGAGIAAITLAALVVLQASGVLAGATDALLAFAIVVAALGLIVAPFALRIGRKLAAERAARIRTQERAEVAAHLHDSVLQTLALVQKQADDPRAVAQLARRQERELRAWLDGQDDRDADASVAAALRTTAAEVEERFGVPVEVVCVGDAPLGEAAGATVAAAREAMTNAAKFAGAGPDAPIAVFAEVADGTLSVFVRDRGPGFDPAAVPADRRGLRESVHGRMARHGGRAVVHAAPGAGVEVELSVAVGA